MIALDNGALIAAFQRTPPPSVAHYRTRVRHFIEENGGVFMVPAVVLSEYLVKFDAADRQEEFNVLLAKYVHVVPFDQHTAEIAADIARKYMTEKQSGPQNAVARQVNDDRVCLKADTLIIATALQHSVTAFLTNDEPADRVAKFAGLNSHLLANLPDPPPPMPINAAPPKGRSVQPIIGFKEPDEEDENEA